MLDDIDNALLPQQIVTPDGRTLNVKRNNLMDNDRPQNMWMEEDKDGVGFEDRKKKEENGNEKKKQQYEADDRLDEHDLNLMEDAERDALFKRDAERGIYRGQRLRTKDKAHLLELDRVDVKNKTIIEDKEARGFDRNPKGVEVAIKNWVGKNIYENAKKKIEFINLEADHIFYDKTDLVSSPYSPKLSDIKQIKSIKYKLKASSSDYDGKLKSKIDTVIKQLKKEYPEWGITVNYK